MKTAFLPLVAFWFALVVLGATLMLTVLNHAAGTIEQMARVL